MSPLLQPNVEIMIATAIMYRPGVPSIACIAVVPTGGLPSTLVAAITSLGRTFKYATLASTYSATTTRTPVAIAKGRSFSGCFISADANPTLFQASIENSEPTIAAPMTGSSPSVTPVAGQKLAPKFAAIATAFLPIVSPSTTRAVSAAVLMMVSEVWMKAAVRTPRTLIQVRTATDAIASNRCQERPTAMSPIGFGKWSIVPANTSAETAGTSTEVNRANATATAAIVPV